MSSANGFHLAPSGGAKAAITERFFADHRAECTGVLKVSALPVVQAAAPRGGRQAGLTTLL